MAKDVDLSSKQWLDIVFDGKNKDYGAYEMRRTSTSRHNKALAIVVAALIALLVILILGVKGFFKSDEEASDADIDQQNVTQYEEEQPDDEEEILELDEPEPEPEPEPEIEPEPLINQIQNTAVDIVDDDKVINEVKTQEELREDDRQMGAQDVTDGIDERVKTEISDQVEVKEEKPVAPKEDIIYTTASVEQQPSFPGGETALFEWINKNISYPAAAAEEGVEGRVVVEFVVSKTGAIEKAKVLRSRHPALDKEALRIVKAMPHWTPGRMNGQPVAVTYTLPVSFKLAK